MMCFWHEAKTLNLVKNLIHHIAEIKGSKHGDPTAFRLIDYLWSMTACITINSLCT